MKDILKRLDLSKHERNFREQEIDVEALKELKDEDLRELGIASARERENILRYAKRLNSLN